MNLSKPREIPYAEIEDLFERLDKSVELEMEDVGVQYPESYKAGYYASMVRMIAWNNPEAYAWLQDFVKHYESKPRLRAKAACSYCGGNCPNDEEHACDGYLGDIDALDAAAA